MSGTAAILLCAGRGERLKSEVPKALAPLAGRPLFTFALQALEESAAIDAIVVVGPARALQAALAASGIAARKVVAWTEGGRERQHSVGRGLAALPAGPDLVAVHDSARALVRTDVVARVIADARVHGAAIAAMPLEDTLKRGALGVIEATVPRAGLFRAQTPQVFRRDWLEEAHRAAGEMLGKGVRPQSATDDAALVEALGHRVHLTPGEAMNFKITTPEDLELAESVLLGRPQPRRN
ncbi:MAG TPA: 2-C-methyl-D-erythritol 4-phosphate cytidylyltransferase [Candidatus Udaeobacter sp.]|nr:2-C-methyl-D-erythritol 4-phosphate cytidylyltransferase [Candidatus Udaeobacter sp.]